MLNVVVALGSLAASLFIPAATAQASVSAIPPADRVAVEVSAVNGSGCPGGSATARVAPGGTSIIVTYSDFEPAWTGANARPIDSRKNCQIGLRVRAPEGVSFALAQADYSGFAHLVNGATAVQGISAYFQGSSQTINRSETFEAPYSDYWQATHRVDWGDLVWQNCEQNRDLNINTSVRVSPNQSPPTRTSFIGLGSPDESQATFHLAWKWC
jgi:hypothetical protein